MPIVSLASGNPPYTYATRVPIRSDKNNPSIGLSGILIEQAQFVLTAERRKLNDLAFTSYGLEGFAVYVNPSIIPSGPYEPKADGSTLSNFLNPGGYIFLDHIEETRVAFDNLCTIMGNDCGHGSGGFKHDWLINTYPGNPNLSSTVNPNYTHSMPSMSGANLSTDGQTLGSSGVLYDCDIGEIMYNPYPHIRQVRLRDLFGIDIAADSQFIETVPFWPAFQTTAGSVISLNGREIDSPPDVTYGHIGSGYVRLDGYVLHSNTDYRLNTLITPLLNGFSSTDDFTHQVEGARGFDFLGSVVGKARVFLSPHVQISGVYRFLARNRRTNFPQTAVESGIISIWPKANESYPLAGNESQAPQNEAYQVFNDALWIQIPSGLMILSPWTGKRMWVRLVDQTRSPTPPNFAWRQMRGLERVGVNTIYKAFLRNVSGPTQVFAVFNQYNDNLDRFGETVTSSIDSSTAIISDMFYDGTDFWIFDSGATGNEDELCG